MDTCDRVRCRLPRLSDDEEDEGDTVQQIADLFSVPRTTVYADLSDASKGERPTITATDEPAGASAG